jgi:hypothetical protein
MKKYKKYEDKSRSIKRIKGQRKNQEEEDLGKKLIEERR